MKVVELIYTLVDPREPGRVRYVGKTDVGLRARLQRHLTEARSGINSYRHKWIRSLLATGVEPVIQAIETVSVDLSWQARERHWILELRAAGHPLVNGSSGGDGLDSASWKTVWSRPGIREQQSAALSKYVRSEAGQKQRSEAGKARWSDPAERARQSARMKLLASATRPALSAATKKSWADPAVRERRIAGLRSGKPRKSAPPRPQAYRIAAAERSRQRWADPGFRAKVLGAMKLAYSSPEAHQRSSDAKKRGWIIRRQNITQVNQCV